MKKLAPMPKKPGSPINFFTEQSTLIHDVRQFGRRLIR